MSNIIVTTPVHDITVDVPVHPVAVVVSTVDVGVTTPTYDITVEATGPQGPPGIQGPIGLPGTGVPTFGEYLIGVKNDSNRVFETSTPFRANTSAVFINGLREDIHEGYVESPPNMIVFDVAPSATDKLTIDYIIE